jgi:hypothetical protein
MNGGGDLEYKYDEVSRKAGQHLLEKAITTGSTESTYDTPTSQYQYCGGRAIFIYRRVRVGVCCYVASGKVGKPKSRS